jgi:methionyl-tRNA formyltransferase
LAAAVPIEPDDTYGTLADRLAPLGAELLVRALRESPPYHEQNDAAATYAEKIRAEDRLLDPARPAVELERVVRALHPHIGAQVQLPDGSPLRVHSSRVVDDEGEAGQGAASGASLFTEGDRLLLRCTPGTLELLVVQPAGGRAMEASAFLRGHRAALAPDCRD